MGNDQVTEVSSQSWFSRIAGSFIGIFFGILLIVAAVFLLFWNEGRAVQSDRSLNEGSKIVVSVPAEVDAKNEGKLVHVSGKAVTDCMLKDPDFHISVNALRLLRSVKMYQWQEESDATTSHDTGGGTTTTTTYTYSTVWSDTLIDSGRFHHQSGHRNPSSFAIESMEWDADPAFLGTFKLTQQLIHLMDFTSPVSMDPNRPLPQLNQGPVRPTSDGYYFGRSRQVPGVGDLEVSFQEVKPTEVSVIAQQTGSSFQAYPTKAGDSIQLLEPGICSPEFMFKKAHDRGRFFTWRFESSVSSWPSSGFCWS